MSKLIQSLTSIAPAFDLVGSKINEIISANPPLQAGGGIKIITAKENRLISTDYTYETFTICENGSPVDIKIACQRIT